VDTLNEFQSTHLKAVDDWLNGARQEFARALDGKASTAAGSADDTPIPPSTNAGVSCTFVHQGKFHSMPSHFEFPELSRKLREAVRFGLCGQSVSDDGRKCVKSFKGMSNNMLPTEELKDAFKLSWKRAFAFLADGVAFPSSQDPAGEQIDEACNNNIDCLKSRVSHCCAAGKIQLLNGHSQLGQIGQAGPLLRRGAPPVTQKSFHLLPAETPQMGNNKRVRKEKPNPLCLNQQQKRKLHTMSLLLLIWKQEGSALPLSMTTTQTILQDRLATCKCQQRWGEKPRNFQPKLNPELKQEGKKLVMLVAMTETSFLLIKDQLHAHKWHQIMDKHQELSGNDLAVIFKAL